MIEFNGQSISDIAPVKILNVAVSSPKPSVIARPIARKDGQVPVYRTNTTRTVTVTFNLLSQEQEQRVWWIERLNSWLSPRDERPLTMKKYPEVYLNVICTGTPDLTLRDWSEVHTIQFTAYDPYFTATHEKTARVNDAFVVTGTQTPKLRITFDGGASTITNARWSHYVGWQLDSVSSFIQIDGAAYASNIEINVPDRIVRNSNGYLPYTLDSRWFNIALGRNAIVGTNGAAGTVHWYERY